MCQSNNKGVMMNSVRDRFAVGICDDHQFVHDSVSEALRKYASLNGIDIDVKGYYEAEELLEKDDKMDLLFLDIDMPGMDGIELGRKLNQKEIDYKIVILSGREDKMKETFKINAFRFVSKPIKETELFSSIDDVRDLMIGTETVTVYKDRISYDIQEKDIVLICVEKSETKIITENNEYRSEKSLIQWMSILNQNMFYKSDKSYIVNIRKIEKIVKNTIYLTNGLRAGISRRQRTVIIRAFAEFDVKRG